MNIREIIKEFIEIPESEVLAHYKKGTQLLLNIYTNKNKEENLFFNKKELKFYKIKKAETWFCQESLEKGWCKQEYICYCYKFKKPNGDYYWQTCLGDYDFEALELTKKEVVLYLMEKEYYEFTNEVGIYNLKNDLKK